MINDTNKTVFLPPPGFVILFSAVQFLGAGSGPAMLVKIWIYSVMKHYVKSSRRNTVDVEKAVTKEEEFGQLLTSNNNTMESLGTVC